jgi:hypothetical protein
MDKYEVFENSMLKNMQEFCEDIVDQFGVENYYDLIDLIYDLWNFRAITKQLNPRLYKDIQEQIEKENSEPVGIDIKLTEVKLEDIKRKELY